MAAAADRRGDPAELAAAPHRLGRWLPAPGRAPARARVRRPCARRAYRSGCAREYFADQLINTLEAAGPRVAGRPRPALRASLGSIFPPRRLDLLHKTPG